LVERLGGKMRVESEEGKGTIFFFTLPIQNTVKQSYYEEKKQYNTKLTNINWSNKTILYVEDDEDNISLMKELLKPTKVKLIIAMDGIEAEEKFKRHKDILDLVLMDVRIPKQDGLETTKKIKKIKDIPVIAQTAYAMKGDREKMLFYGCDDYISKPLDEDELLRKIEYFFHATMDKQKKGFFGRFFSR
jgi:CheY-like chemotaxis protein